MLRSDIATVLRIPHRASIWALISGQQSYMPSFLQGEGLVKHILSSGGLTGSGEGSGRGRGKPFSHYVFWCSGRRSWCIGGEIWPLA